MEHQFARIQISSITGFGSLPQGVINVLTEKIRAQRYDAGATIVRHNDNQRDLYVVLSGCVRVSLVAIGGRSITFQLLPAGELFGEVSAIDGLSRTASVVAETESVVGQLSSQDLLSLVRSSPEFSLALLERMARLNRRLAGRLFEYHTYDVRGRIYLELIRLTEDNGGASFAITDKDMASRVGTTRENVSRIHAQLRKDKLIERSKSNITSINAEGIRLLLPGCEFT
jgi:CRP/FNR family cyclic AMP-dependent transcriptional regulator